MKKAFQYALAYYDRKFGTVSSYIKLPVEGAPENEALPVFLKGAGEYGWVLCGTFDTYLSDGIRTIQGNPEHFAKATGKAARNIEDPKEVIELVFVRET